MNRIQKKLKEMVLLDQPFIRDSSMTIEDLVKKNISTLGENIQIRRFERFVLGEGLEKKNENFSEIENYYTTSIYFNLNFIVCSQ